MEPAHSGTRDCRVEPPASILVARLSMSHLVPLLEFNLLEVTIFPSDQHLKFSTTLCTDHLHRSHSLRWNLRFRRQTQHFPGPGKHPGQTCKFFQHIRSAPQKCRRVEIKLPSTNAEEEHHKSDTRSFLDRNNWPPENTASIQDAS